MTKMQASHVVEQQLHNLRIFVSVADTESISRAAKQLFKVPSAITRSIVELERAIGVPLFDRKPRGMLLNAYGEAVLVRARRINDEIQLAVDEFLDPKAKASPSSRTSISILLFNSRKLQLLIHLVELRSLSSAAVQMELTPAGVSMALARIEGVFGQSLFHRGLEGMIATESAGRLVMRAKRIFAELRHIESDISVISGNLTGSVVIGTTPLGRTQIFATAIATATAHHQGLRVTTVDNSYDHLLASLRSGEIDFMFGALRSRNQCQGLVTEPLLIDRLAIVVRAKHPLVGKRELRLSELLRERWIFPRMIGRPLVDASFRKMGLQPPVPAVEAGDPSVIRQLLVASDMLAVTSPLQLVFEIESGALVELPVTLEGTIREVGLVVRDGAMLSPAARAVLESVRSQIQVRRELQ
jgi:LysR family transcriptional regulator of gallate degradation